MPRRRRIRAALSGTRGELARPFFLSATTHVTLLGIGVLWGILAAGTPSREARAYSLEFDRPAPDSFGLPESETLAVLEPPRLEEPRLEESQLWAEEAIAPDESPAPAPWPRPLDWSNAYVFDTGRLPMERPEPVEIAQESSPAGTVEEALIQETESHVVTEPVPLEVPPPDYPRLSRRAGEEGKVLLRLHLDRDGRVERVEVVESSGYARLDEAARKAMAEWRFSPRRVDGRACAASLLHQIDFQLGE